MNALMLAASFLSLSHPDWRHREAATATFTRLAPQFGDAAEHLARSTPHPERRFRAAGAVRRMWAARAAGYVPTSAPGWRPYREATERYARGLVADGVPTAEVDGWLRRAWADELEATKCRFPGDYPAAVGWDVGYAGGPPVYPGK